MKTIEQLNKHLSRCKSCGKEYFIFNREDIKYNINNAPAIKPLAVAKSCGSYFCPHCAKKKQKKIFAKTINGIKNESWRFITLTTINNSHEFFENSTLANNAWNKLATLIRRRFNNFKFVKVAELGKNGMFHFHILINIYIPQPLLKYYWEKYTNAYIVDIRRVQSNYKAVSYITKYINKTFNNQEINEKFFLNQKRRFSFSRNFGSKFVKTYKYIKLYNTTFTYNSAIEILNIISQYQDLLNPFAPRPPSVVQTAL